jgi:3-isopropylmalate dehydrogenase
MTTHKLLFLPGDGIGPEVAKEVGKVLDLLASRARRLRDGAGPRSAGAAIDAHGIP